MTERLQTRNILLPTYLRPLYVMIRDYENNGRSEWDHETLTDKNNEPVNGLPAFEMTVKQMATAVGRLRRLGLVTNIVEARRDNPSVFTMTHLLKEINIEPDKFDAVAVVPTEIVEEYKSTSISVTPVDGASFEDYRKGYRDGYTEGIEMGIKLKNILFNS